MEAFTTKLSVVDVAPGMRPNVAPPSVLTYHCTVGTGVPVAAAVNVAVSPTFSVSGSGFKVTAGLVQSTPSVAVLLCAPAVGVWVVVTPEVWLLLPPVVLLVTLKVTVQLPLAGIAIPVKLSAVAPAPRVPGVVPVQVPPTAPPTALMFTSVSVNAPPVRAVALLLARVRVTAELPPHAIVAGWKPL